MTDSIHLLTGAYVVDALEPDERLRFEQHLAQCPDCQVELAELTETVGLLGAAAAIAPPASMKAAVLARIDTVRQVPPLPTVIREDDGEQTPEVAATNVVPLGAGRRQAAGRPATRWGARLLGVAAAVLALVAATLGTLLVQDRSAKDELAARSQAVARVLTAPDARTSAADIAGGGRGAVVVSASQGAAVLVTNALPGPPTGRTYEMWFIDSAGKAVPAGTFAPDSGGSTAQLLNGSPSGSALVGVTVEPSGGSAQPTTKPILAVPLA